VFEHLDFTLAKSSILNNEQADFYVSTSINMNLHKIKKFDMVNDYSFLLEKKNILHLFIDMNCPGDKYIFFTKIELLYCLIQSKFTLYINNINLFDILKTVYYA